MIEEEKLDGYYAIRVERDIQEGYRKLPRESRRKVNEQMRKLLRKLILEK